MAVAHIIPAVQCDSHQLVNVIYDFNLQKDIQIQIPEHNACLDLF